jgi:DNA uptake protein ComE-like DNA-binding protein
MSQLTKSILFFSKTERQGLIALSVLIIIILWIPLLLAYLFPPDPASLEAFAVRTKLYLASKPVQGSHYYSGEGYHAGQGGTRKYGSSRQNGGSGQYAATTVAVIAINSADSAMVAGLPGISPSLAGRVLRFRNRLGGFVDSRQYGEVWGCSERARNSLQAHTRIDTSLVKRINLNSCDFKELMRHPYGGYELAKAICRFRDKFGKLSSREELRQANIIADSSYRKLYPYLKTD